MDQSQANETLPETLVWTSPTLGACAAGLVNAVARGMTQIVAPHGLTQIDLALLRLFLGVEESFLLFTTRLAQALPLASASISRTVTKLVDMGLIPEMATAERQESRHSDASRRGYGAGAAPAPARPSIRRQALRGRRRGADGGFRLRHFQGNGGPCRHGIGGQVLTALHTRVHRFFRAQPMQRRTWMQGGRGTPAVSRGSFWHRHGGKPK